MQLRLLAFARTRDDLGFSERVLDVSPAETPRQLMARVAPRLVIAQLRVAVDREYHDWDHPIGEASEVALIPPVSGG